MAHAHAHAGCFDREIDIWFFHDGKESGLELHVFETAWGFPYLSMYHIPTVFYVENRIEQLTFPPETEFNLFNMYIILNSLISQGGEIQFTRP